MCSQIASSCFVCDYSIWLSLLRADKNKCIPATPPKSRQVLKTKLSTLSGSPKQRRSKWQIRYGRLQNKSSRSSVD